MDFNKVAAGLLTAAIVVVGSLILSETVFAPDTLKTQSYIIEVAQTESADSGKAAAPTFATGDAFLALVDAGDVKKGADITKKCVACHGFENGGANKVGPNLWAVVGADIAHHAGYSYSAALSGKEGVWDIENLNHWLYNTQSFAKGTKMAFAGIKDDKQRADLIAYLKTLK